MTFSIRMALFSLMVWPSYYINPVFYIDPPGFKYYLSPAVDNCHGDECAELRAHQYKQGDPEGIARAQSAPGRSGQSRGPD